MDLEENDQVVQNEVPTTMEQLPIEAQFEILKWLDDWDLGHYAQQVCRLWHAIGDEWIGREVYPDTQVRGHPSKVGLELTSEIGVRKLTISENCWNYSALNKLPSSLPPFKFPHLVKEIILYVAVQSNYWQVFSTAFNLTRFTLNLCALVPLTFQDLEQLNFQRLKDLRMIGYGGVNGQPPSVAPLPNLRIFLRDKRFLRLSSLSISNLPVESAGDLETVGLLVRFILAHPRIKMLDVGLMCARPFVPTNRLVYEGDLKPILDDIRTNKSCASLKSYQYWGPCRPGTYPHYEIFTELLLKQSMLEEVELNMGFMEDDNIRTLCSRNQSTLKRVKIDQWLPPEEPLRQMDMSMFSSLPLVNFHFSGLRLVLTGAHHLPPTLEEIVLSGHIPSADIEVVLLHLPNLRRIYLFNGFRGAPPPEEGYWVTLRTLQQFAENRRAISLSLTVVEGVGLPEEGISNGDPINPIMLRLSRARGEYSDVRWMLNEDGYYINDPNNR